MAIRRRMGASAEHREKLEREFASLIDWRAKCPACGSKVSGSLADLKRHACEGRP